MTKSEIIILWDAESLMERVGNLVLGQLELRFCRLWGHDHDLSILALSIMGNLEIDTQKKSRTAETAHSGSGSLGQAQERWV